MSTVTNQSETVLLDEGIILSDEVLDHVVGGLNPQPLPPHDPNLGEYKPGGCPPQPYAFNAYFKGQQGLS